MPNSYSVNSTHNTFVEDSYSITFCGNSNKIILKIHSNGQIEWFGDRDDVVRKFWQSVENVGMNLYSEGYRNGYKDASKSRDSNPIRPR